MERKRETNKHPLRVYLSYVLWFTISIFTFNLLDIKLPDSVHLMETVCTSTLSTSSIFSR